MENNFLKIFIIFGACLIILFFLSQDFAWTGQLEFKTDFKRFTPFVSILKPQDQVEIKDLAYIKKEPVWLDVYLPRDFDKINLEFTYKNDSNYEILVGPKLYEENNPLKPLENQANPVLPNTENGFKIKSIEFDLTAIPIRMGKLRFLISIPDLKDESKGIFIKELKVDLQRKAIWQENLRENIFNYFNYFKNEFR
jgi:hypothetical protein